MNPRQLSYEVQKSMATTLPGGVITAMGNRDGDGVAGLLLTRPALQTLDDYLASVQRLPSDLAQARSWLGYEQVAEPELTPAGMLLLFKQLSVHAGRWKGLREQCRGVTEGLRKHAAGIEAEGARVVDLAARTRALGANKNSWQSLQQALPVGLDAHDRQLVASMGATLVRLHGVVDDYDQQVDTLRIGLQAFRDDARTRLVPTVLEKCRAARRFAGGATVSDLNWELDMLDNDIRALKREYERYSRQSSAGWLGGPFGFLISNSIYGARAKTARAELKALEQRRQVISQRLAQQVRVQGRVNELHSELQRLEIDLWDGVVSSGHLHTAWQTVEAYLESSMERLQRMDTGQQLAIFMFHFRQFLGQWAAIGEQAKGMLKVFG